MSLWVHIFWYRSAFIESWHLFFLFFPHIFLWFVWKLFFLLYLEKSKKKKVRRRKMHKTKKVERKGKVERLWDILLITISLYYSFIMTSRGECSFMLQALEEHIKRMCINLQNTIGSLTHLLSTKKKGVLNKYLYLGGNVCNWGWATCT